MPEEDDVVMEPEDGEGNPKSADNKLKDLREELKKAKKERDEYLDSLQRMKADYINAKKRFEEEKQALGAFASVGVVLDLLPVMDALEQALAHQKADKKGIEGIKSQLEKLLSSHGVVSFDSTGEVFDPAQHESVGILATKKESEDNRVTSVHQKGYSLNGRIIRPARVTVGHFISEELRGKSEEK